MKQKPLWATLTIVFLLAATADSRAQSIAQRLTQAREFVEQSDRYLHHSRLTPGMQGHGISVFFGTKPEKFQAEIVSVVPNFNVRKDVILARLSGQNLKETRVIQGMSGSPVYMTDPRDGKVKMIGAVAYGWGLSTDALCGIQPITQMLAMSGVLEHVTGEQTPATQPAEAAAPRDARDLAGLLRPGLTDPAAFLEVALGRADFEALYADQRTSGDNGLIPLRTPLSIGGVDDKTLAAVRGLLGPAGLMPLAGGGVGDLPPEELANVEMEPGGSLAVPFVTGDVGWAGIGTVTDVVDGTVLGFGHSMFGQGEVDVPMSTGYVHSIVSLLTASFKLGAAIQPVGTLRRDEVVGVAGTIGPKPHMIPMTVRIRQAVDEVSQTYRYNVLDLWFLTPRLVPALVFASGSADRQPPMFHHVRYTSTVDYGPLGTMTIDNVDSQSSLSGAAMNTAWPMATLLATPFGPPPEIRSIALDIEILPESIEARILDVKLDAAEYEPGESVTGTVLIEPFRKERRVLKFSLDLPADLPEGEYPLTVGDQSWWAKQRMKEQPHIETIRTTEELFTALKQVHALRGDELYIHLPLPSAGVAVGREELPDIPGSKALVLISAELPDTQPYQQSKLTTQRTEFVLTGNKTVELVVRKQTGAMSPRNHEEQE